MRITVTTQAEFDALPPSFEEYTIIDIRGRITVRGKRGNSSVEARENSSVEAWGNSSVVARENSSVVACGNSSVEAWENSSVEAWENSSVVAWGNSSVEAWENSSVEARENSSVVAWENSSVEAWGNSSVVARGNSSVEAWENSSVEARENSSVVAWGNSLIRAYSATASIVLFAASMCMKHCDTEVQIKSPHAVVTKATPRRMATIQDWIEQHGLEVVDGHCIVFKRVSKDWKTQEGTKNETTWAPGTSLEHLAWNPVAECGPGKFHACARAFFCNEFRSAPDDRYVAIRVPVSEMHFFPDYTYEHKVSFRACAVLWECNRHGKKLEAA